MIEFSYPTGPPRARHTQRTGPEKPISETLHGPAECVKPLVYYPLRNRLPEFVAALAVGMCSSYGSEVPI